MARRNSTSSAFIDDDMQDMDSEQFDNGGSSLRSRRSQEQASRLGSDFFSDIGHKGGMARWHGRGGQDRRGSDRADDRAEFEDDKELEDDLDEDDIGSSRGGSRGGSRGSTGRRQRTSASTHQRLSQAGKKGAARRWGNEDAQFDDDMNDDDMDDDMLEEDAGSSRGGSRGGQRGSGGSSRRGFAAMPKDQVREIASMGGRASHGGGRRGQRRADDLDDLDDDMFDDEQAGGSNRGGQRSGHRGGNDRRGFAAMPREQVREIAAMGGRASHGGGRRGMGQPEFQGAADKPRRGRIAMGLEDFQIKTRSMGDSDLDEFSDLESVGLDKDPGRVRAGRKAAQARSHEELAEQGRRGGRSRQGQPFARGQFVLERGLYGR